MTALVNSEIDWFAAFRNKDGQKLSEGEATRATEATKHENNRHYRVIEGVESVAQNYNVTATGTTKVDSGINVASVAREDVDQATVMKLIKNNKNKDFHEDIACVASVAHERYDVATFIKRIEERAEILEYVGMVNHFESIAQAYEEQRNDWYERNSNDPNN